MGRSLYQLATRLAVSLPPAQDPRDNRARALWKKPVYRLAVILVDYPDVKHAAPVALGPAHSARRRPAPVAVHDDGDMEGFSDFGR